MEKLTFGQAIDRLKLNEVAIKVELDEKYNIPSGYHKNVGFFYDTEDNNILKALNGSELFIAYNTNEDSVLEYFIILDKEEYEEVMIVAKYGDIILNANKDEFIEMPEGMSAQEYREWRKGLK